MMKRLDEKDLATRRPFEGGFTLIELLVVVIILGILAAVVVFSVGGVGDKGQEAACKVDTKTIKTAEAAAFTSAREDTGKGFYSSEQKLVDNDLLSDLSSLHNIEVSPTASATPTAYAITMTQKGADACIPEGAEVADCAPETTLPTAGSEVGICTDPGPDTIPDTDDDVRYPF